MQFPSKKKKHNLKRVTPNPKSRVHTPPKSPVQYDPGIVMTYMKPLLDMYGRKQDDRKSD